MPNAHLLLRADERALFDFVVQHTIKNNKELESQKRKLARDAVLVLTLLLGMSGNFLYHPYSTRFAARLTVLPGWLRSVLAGYFIACNGTTNGILTSISLVKYVYNWLKKCSKAELAIYQSEIPHLIRLGFNLSALTLSAGSQLSSAYLAYLPKESLARGALLMASNIGFTQDSLYKPMCYAYVTRRLSPHEKKIEHAKGAFKQHLQSMRNQIIINLVKKKIDTQQITKQSIIAQMASKPSSDLINELINTLGRDDLINDNAQSEQALRNICTYIELNAPPPGPGSIAQYTIPAAALFFNAWLLMFHWYGGGDGGEALVAGLTGSKEADASSSNTSDTLPRGDAYYSFASFTVFCNVYLTTQYVYGALMGTYLMIKYWHQGIYAPYLSSVLFPTAVKVWLFLSLFFTLGSPFFGAEFALMAFPPGIIQNGALSFGMISVVLLLGFGMFSITDLAVLLVMGRYANEDQKKVIRTDGKLAELQEITDVASHKVFAKFLQSVFEKFNLENKFNITAEEINAYLDSLPKETTPLLDEELGAPVTHAWGNNVDQGQLSINATPEKKSSWKCCTLM